MYFGHTYREEAHERATAEPPAPLPPIYFSYRDARAQLEAMRRAGAPDPHLGHQLRYLDPATGGWAMPTIATMARLLPAGFRSAPYRSTDSAVFTVVEGRGEAEIAGARFDIAPRDVFVVPGWMLYTLRADEDLIVFSYSDRAAQEKLGFFRDQRSAG
jgi:gentisate 1,2-dioxygenase